MGRIDARLQRLLDSVEPNARLPVIVTTQNGVTEDVLQQARRAGAQNVRGLRIAEAYQAQATPRTIRTLEDLPSTDTVHYNEPVATLTGGP